MLLAFTIYWILGVITIMRGIYLDPDRFDRLVDEYNLSVCRAAAIFMIIALWINPLLLIMYIKRSIKRRKEKQK